MKVGAFEYKSIKSTAFDIVSTTKDRPFMPQMNSRQLKISGMHGTYDFGRNTYGNIQITVNITYIGKNYVELKSRTRQIAAWLSSEKYEKLVFEDEPDKYYLARVYNETALNVFYRMGQATITFDCLPFALYKATSGQDLTWVDDLIWGMDISWDTKSLHTYVINENTSFDIDYIGTQEVGLGSPTGSKFDIVITGSFTTLSITLNGKTINYNEAISGQTVVVNNVDATIKIGTTNKLPVSSGDLISFLNLIPGTNTVEITGTGLNCSMLFDFRPQYL